MNRTLPTLVSLSLLLFAGAVAFAGDHAMHPMAQNLPDIKFGPVPGLPACAPGAVMSGDPSKGTSIIIGKLDAGCTIPWHWHTPDEHLMIVSGSARLEPKDGEAMTLNAGAYAKMPGKHVHQFTCTTPCSLYVYSDAAFDIHYVDAKGAEITPADALGAVKETVATMGR